MSFNRLSANRAALLTAAALLPLLLAGCEHAIPTETQKLVPVQPHFVVNIGERAQFYFHAHQDDWQLFMGDQANTGLQTAGGVVFIYTTAGDSGDPPSYWQTRETAARVAVDALIGAGNWTCGQQVINGHSIHRCTKGKAAAYDMRLPNCPMSAESYNGRGCIGDLRNGSRATLAAIDGSTTYTSWTDLTNTLRGIVDYESNGQAAPYVEVHAPDYNRSVNADRIDHPDHLSTADAVHAAAGSRSWNISWYMDYQTQNQAANLTQAAHDIKQAAFYAYDNYMGAAGFGRDQYDASYQAWLWRTIFRSEISTPPPPPSTPTNLAAQVRSATRIDLTWTASTNTTGYFVERAPDNNGTAGAYALVATLQGSSNTSYSNTGLTGTTTYWFRIRAFNATDVSGYSTAINATTLLAPAAPSNLAAAPISTTRIDLSWTDNATNETAYLLERAPDNSGTAGTYAQIASLAAGSVAYSNTGLAANTRYWYRVRAMNATDTSAYSSAISASTPLGPAAPSNLQAQAISASQINLTWTDNTTSETGFTLERAPDNNGSAGTFASIATLPVNAVSYSDASLTQNTRYWYRVRSFNAVDVSAYSNTANATTPPLPPVAPSGLVASPVSSSRIDLAWTDNSNNETAILVERALDAGGAPGTFSQIASLAANTTAYSNTGLIASTPYWYRVRATNSAGNSAYSNSSAATTPAAPSAHTDFYFHAHQDDWQLFMGDHAWSSVQSASKVVFVYSTAGDSGDPSTYWLTRETAARVSVDALIGAGSWSCGSQAINGHSIHRCVKGKAVSYDMRLPNCAMSMEGYNGRGCLSDLRDGGRSTLPAIDGSTTYTSWTDLANTMRGIVDFESNNQSAPYVQVNAPDYDRTVNVVRVDHPDHIATADAVQAAAASRTWDITWYQDYGTKTRAINLTQAQHDQKAASFLAYDNYMGNAGYGRNQYDSDYQNWLWRTYFR
jgi:LmbE family N-acetylglucosaminyl deacetylase